MSESAPHWVPGPPGTNMPKKVLKLQLSSSLARVAAWMKSLRYVLANVLVCFGQMDSEFGFTPWTVPTKITSCAFFKRRGLVLTSMLSVPLAKASFSSASYFFSPHPVTVAQLYKQGKIWWETKCWLLYSFMFCTI